MPIITITNIRVLCLSTHCVVKEMQTCPFFKMVSSEGALLFSTGTSCTVETSTYTGQADTTLALPVLTTHQKNQVLNKDTTPPSNRVADLEAMAKKYRVKALTKLNLKDPQRFMRMCFLLSSFLERTFYQALDN